MIGAIFESIVLFYLGNNRNCRINFVFLSQRCVKPLSHSLFVLCIVHLLRVCNTNKQTTFVFRQNIIFSPCFSLCFDTYDDWFMSCSGGGSPVGRSRLGGGRGAVQASDHAVHDKVRAGKGARDEGAAGTDGFPRSISCVATCSQRAKQICADAAVQFTCKFSFKFAEKAKSKYRRSHVNVHTF